MADDKIYGLSDKDVGTLKQMLAEYRSRRQNGQLPPTPGDIDFPSAPLYVGKLSSASELDELDDGSDPPLVFGEEFDIYRLVREEPDNKLRAVPELSRYVYNIGPAPVPDDEWVFVQQDRFGDWYTRGSL